MKTSKVLLIILLIVLIFAIIILLFRNDSFKDNEYIMKVPQCTSAGLGDRIGEYIMYSTLGKIYNCKVLVYWSKRNKNWASRSHEYPKNILNHINFPNNLKFVIEKNWKSSNIPLICKYREEWPNYYYGDEFVPELIHKALNLEKYLSVNDYINLYKDTAAEIYYKKELPKLPINFSAVHVRRGDKEIFNFDIRDDYDKRLNNVFNKLKLQEYILCTEKSNPIKSKNPISIKLSKDKITKTLQEFFILCKANLIIQSIPGRKRYDGWSSFSFIASKIGNSKLYNCSTPGTRLYEMENKLGKKLNNVIKYTDII